MTTQEFKQQHPELAHLEGNDLWNAMENALYIQQQGQTIINTTKLFWRRYQLRWLFYRRKRSMIFGKNDYTSSVRCSKCKKGCGGPKLMWMNFNDDSKSGISCPRCRVLPLIEEKNTNLDHILYTSGKKIVKDFWWLFDKLHLVRSSIDSRYSTFGDESHYVKSRHYDENWNFVKSIYRKRKWWEYIFIKRK